MFDTGNHGKAVSQLLKEFVIIKKKKRFSLSRARMEYRLCMNNISGAARTNKTTKMELQAKIVNGLNC